MQLLPAGLRPRPGNRTLSPSAGAGRAPQPRATVLTRDGIFFFPSSCLGASPCYGGDPNGEIEDGPGGQAPWPVAAGAREQEATPTRGLYVK
jgi:hypothetical protein